ncbi:(+)-NEOMENTHOL DEHYDROGENASE [Salix viminalis]|uniref:Short-chain dehydrogenase/reductase n=1 Tax=Salix viminalis TaxID=40686 RepID=A0A9Q0NLX4_SALVM|nr:(+)-NEOMENTHOL DEHYDROGENASE [Salix viminalis]
MGSKERAKERREKRLQEISLLRTIPYSDHQRVLCCTCMWIVNCKLEFWGIWFVRGLRWWSSETVAVVTGGNRGIGSEIARQLADHGLTVILTSRESSAGLEASNALKELGLSVDYHQLDVLDSLSIKKLAEWIEQTYGGIDVLVNNAGVNYNLGADNSVEHAQNVVATNYYGTKNVSQALIPLMRPSAVGARIVNVSSRLGRLNGRRNRLEDKDLREKLANLETLSEELIDRMVSTFLQQVEEGTYTSGGWPQMFTDYSVSKLAVNAFTRLMAKMLSDRPDGQKIYINCYCPGWVKTAMTGWAGNISAEDGADTGVWLALLQDQAITGKFFAERREINF